MEFGPGNSSSGQPKANPKLKPPRHPHFNYKNFFNTNFVFYNLTINGEGRMGQEVAKNTEQGNCKRLGGAGSNPAGGDFSRKIVAIGWSFSERP
jgi:hypothetical protein